MYAQTNVIGKKKAKCLYAYDNNSRLKCDERGEETTDDSQYANQMNAVCFFVEKLRGMQNFQKNLISYRMDASSISRD